MNFRNYLLLTILCISALTSQSQLKPAGVRFDSSTLMRKGHYGDNWCQTWAIDDNIYTMLDDGNGWWGSAERLSGLTDWEGSMMLQINGDKDFTAEDVKKMPGWPINVVNSPLYAYGTLAVDSTIYVWLWKSETDTWYQRPVANRLMYTKDLGKTFIRWNGKPETYQTYSKLDSTAFFFYKEDPRPKEGRDAYAFNWIAFLQNGKANAAAKDEYIYMYSPEQFDPQKLALARVHKNNILEKAQYEYFRGFDGGKALWTKEIKERGYTIEFPSAGENEQWMWASWFPDIVYNAGLDLYIMTSYGIKDPKRKFWDGWCNQCPLPGSLGFWYAEKPWGPWKQFYYADTFYPSSPENRTYGMKLNPKWISKDGRKMVLVWSDAGNDHSTWYKWNQMEIEILLK